MFPALQRFFEAAECRTQAELAEFLGIKQSSISDAKRRKTIPPDWLLTALRKKGIRPDWILTGQGARMLQSCDGTGTVVPLHVPVLEIRPPEECTMEELMVEIFRRASKTINKNKLY
ncbi:MULTISPECIES: helix-turn-helix domain-containing protein [Bilophila]|uniref:helix-turn-helix domain-containing protein n=1 Tax=Bilophila TaxID=35832 RepID=UPI00058804F5|nr:MULTISPECIES: helix-turn-helix domain-containing protein [Bilophila]MBS5454132.1 helix-turn-helix domain-containing protein [Bilophila sp.]